MTEQERKLKRAGDKLYILLADIELKARQVKNGAAPILHIDEDTLKAALEKWEEVQK